MMEHTILIVDDEEGVRNALTRALRPEGYRIGRATGPKEAFDYLNNERVDLVISDHKMPRMTGLEFLTRVREDFPDTVRIMLTGHADIDTVIDAVNMGEIYRFLTKPWDDDELKVSIRLALSHLDLQREHQHLRERLEQQDALIRRIESQHPGLLDIHRDASGAILLDDEALTHGEAPQ